MISDVLTSIAVVVSIATGCIAYMAYRVGKQSSDLEKERRLDELGPHPEFKWKLQDGDWRSDIELRPVVLNIRNMNSVRSYTVTGKYFYKSGGYSELVSKVLRPESWGTFHIMENRGLSNLDRVEVTFDLEGRIWTFEPKLPNLDKLRERRVI